LGGEACSEDAELPFENILDRLTGSDPIITDYVLEVRRGASVASSGAATNVGLGMPTTRWVDIKMLAGFTTVVKPARLVKATLRG
jgi:hypothetical protein